MANLVDRGSKDLLILHFGKKIPISGKFCKVSQKDLFPSIATLTHTHQHATLLGYTPNLLSAVWPYTGVCDCLSSTHELIHTTAVTKHREKGHQSPHPPASLNFLVSIVYNSRTKIWSALIRCFITFELREVTGSLKRLGGVAPTGIRKFPKRIEPQSCLVSLTHQHTPQGHGDLSLMRSILIPSKSGDPEGGKALYVEEEKKMVSSRSQWSWGKMCGDSPKRPHHYTRSLPKNTET